MRYCSKFTAKLIPFVKTTKSKSKQINNIIPKFSYQYTSTISSLSKYPSTLQTKIAYYVSVTESLQTQETL
jgi:hypothetical protein